MGHICCHGMLYEKKEGKPTHHQQSAARLETPYQLGTVAQYPLCATKDAQLTGFPATSVLRPLLGGLNPYLCRVFIFCCRMASKASSMASLLRSCSLYSCKCGGILAGNEEDIR